MKQIEDLVVPGSGSRFSGEDFRLLCGPLVYIFVQDSRPLYIGMSRNGLGRTAGIHKQAEEARKECDEVLIFPARSVDAAREIEVRLIGLFQPMYNRRLQGKMSRRQAAESLGISYEHVRRLGFCLPSTPAA